MFQTIHTIITAILFLSLPIQFIVNIILAYAIISLSAAYIANIIIEIYNFTSYVFFWYLAFVLIALLLSYLFYNSLFFVSENITRLGVYHKNKKDDPVFGETQRERFLKVYWCYLRLTLPVYISVIYILEPTPEQLTGAFIISLPMIISFLVSLRIISNPTKHGLLKFKSIDLFYVTPEAKKAAYNTIKERMLSFYFALIEATLFYFFMRYVFYLWNESPKTFESFIALISPNTSIPAFISFLIAYLIALFISAGISEGILRIWEPIDQI